MSNEDLLRYRHFSVFILLGVPTMLVFGIHHLLEADFLLFFVILLSGAGLLVGWMAVHRSGQGQQVYRINGLLYLGLLLYLLALGGEEGSKALWLYTAPMIGIFLFGKIEGLTWSLATLVCSGGLIHLPMPVAVYPYAADFQIRFLLTYLIVTAISFSFEHLRQSYQLGMEQHQTELEKEQTSLREQIIKRTEAEKEKEQSISQLQQALAEVERLRGLMPMCSCCRKIRNDSGFWKDLETYLEDHADVRFTHGLCPDCVEELYPDFKPPNSEPAAGS